MCLIILAHQHHPDYALVLAANRDEFYERPTQRAHFWTPEHPTLLAGRDLRSGGTWLGITRTGRFAAITNYREPGKHQPDAPSRGHLVADYLKGTASPSAYLSDLASDADVYNGFNLLVGTPDEVLYFSNRDGVIRPLAAGMHGLSNHLLNTPWPKIRRGKTVLESALSQTASAPSDLAHTLLRQLHDPTQAPDDDLPDTGVGLDWERRLSPMHISTPTYGTRSASVLLIGHDGQVTFAERLHGPEATEVPDQLFQFEVTS